MAIMERGKPKQLPLLSQDTITMDTAIMEVMDTVIMERERLMLSLATTIMAMDIMDMVDMVMATMERGKPKQLPLLSQDTITMDTATMEVMDTVIMERERLLLSQDTITMDTAIMEVMDTAIMERERL